MKRGWVRFIGWIGGPVVVSAVSLVVAVASLAVSWSIHSNQGLHYSWGRVSSHVPGNSGVAGALEYLYSRGEDLRWIDLRPVSPALAADGAEARTGDDVLTVAREVDLTGASLRGAWFDETDFTDAILREADLNRVRARRAQFEKADMSNALMKGARFNDSNLSGASLVGADADGAFFIDATLRSARLDGSSMKRAKLQRVQASEASFFDADLTGAEMADGNFRGAVFTGARLAKADLTYGDLGRASFADADLSGAWFVRAIVWETDFSRAHLSGADFAGARELGDAKWDGVWAWKDRQPAFPKNAGIDVVLYDPRCRKAWEENAASAEGPRYAAPENSCRASAE